MNMFDIVMQCKSHPGTADVVCTRPSDSETDHSAANILLICIELVEPGRSCIYSSKPETFHRVVQRRKVSEMPGLGRKAMVIEIILYKMTKVLAIKCNEKFSIYCK